MKIILKKEKTEVYRVSGRGTIFRINRLDYTKKERSFFKKGETVILEEQEYEIRDVEVSIKLISPPTISNNIGLIVRKKK